MHVKPSSIASSARPLPPELAAMKWGFAVLVLAFAALWLPGVAAADQVQDGKALFAQQCSGCHTVGGGDTAGPDLKGVIGRSGEDGTRDFITDPAGVIAAGDPKVAALVKKFNGLAMPDLGLTDVQVDSIVAYLAAEEGSTGGATTTPPSAPALVGDVAAGRHLFTGEKHFARGGPGCMSCHTIAAANLAVGGRVGPDLTGAYAKYGGAQGVASMLATLPFPSMQPVYHGHELAEQEQADLAAFLKTSVGKDKPDDRTFLLVALGLGVMACALVLASLVWPRRGLVVRRRIAPTSNLTRRR